MLFAGVPAVRGCTSKVPTPLSAGALPQKQPERMLTAPPGFVGRVQVHTDRVEVGLPLPRVQQTR